MNLPKFSVRYLVTVAMLMLTIGILGFISFNRLGTDLLPSIYNPRIVVEIRSGERSPQDMEQRFARDIEGALGTISNVVEVRSVCRIGRVIAHGEHLRTCTDSETYNPFCDLSQNDGKVQRNYSLLATPT